MSGRMATSDDTAAAPFASRITEAYATDGPAVSLGKGVERRPHCS